MSDPDPLRGEDGRFSELRASITRTLGSVRQATYVDGLWNGRPLGEWIPEIVDDVVESFDPARVIVFGSVARGEAGVDSDVDLLVLFDRLGAEDYWPARDGRVVHDRSAA